jgi:cytochrome c-type biogenesis protein CcmH
MSRRVHNYVYLVAIVALLAVVVIGLIPRDAAVETDAERAHRIAGELRCPFCRGESIADAPSGIGSDLRALIDEQVASGMSDEEIFDYYVSVYTERVLLSPPLFGWGLLLWLLPVLLLSAGTFAVLRRRRGPVPVLAGAAFATTGALEDARSAVARDLADLDIQEAAGELDSTAGARLRATYEAERDALAEAVIRPPVNISGGRGRTVAGAAVLIGGALALTVLVVLTVRERSPGDLVTGGIASDAQELDFSTISDEKLEETVAAFPDSIPIRMALAARYFNAGDFSPALDHYIEVLNRERHPEALANVGWMTFQSGDSDTALDFVEQSLAVTQELPLPYWYLANIRYYGFADPAGAVEPLETLLAFQLPEEFRSIVTDLLAEVRAAS